MKNKIKITISGASASGKSTITYIILKALEEKGFDIDFDDVELDLKTNTLKIDKLDSDFRDKEEFEYYSSKNLKNKIQSVCDKSRITVTQTHQHKYDHIITS